MTFVELQSQVLAGNFTATHNPLEDFLFARLPDDYYRVWRFLWRMTFGWNKTADFLSMRDIAEGAGIGSTTTVSRVLNFFALITLIAYVPGQHNKIKSHITVLPNGLPTPDDLSFWEDYIQGVKSVENAEVKLRKQDKHFAFDNGAFCQRVAAVAGLFAPNGNLSDAGWAIALDLPTEPAPGSHPNPRPPTEPAPGSHQPLTEPAPGSLNATTEPAPGSFQIHTSSQTHINPHTNNRGVGGAGVKTKTKTRT